MQMRKGTHSCLPCRRRKVRCWFPSPQASVCVHCARRKTACIPQGDNQHASVPSTDPQLGTATTAHQDLVPFFEALHRLRQHVEASLRASADHQRMSSWSSLGSDTVQSSCAPVIQLLNHQLIGGRAESLRRHAGRPNADPGNVAKLLPPKQALILQEMCAVLPSDTVIAKFLTTRSQWWGTWRHSFGLAWGEEEDSTLIQFATRSVRAENPSLLGSLLLCFALSSGDYSQYLVPVEQWVLADDFYTTRPYDFQCLMGLGLCLLSALQPRRAWMVYRKANALLQLAGIHRSRRRSETLDLIFWQLFSADRWVSLLIGLPYSVLDHLCYLPISPIEQSTPATFHHRHMIILTGRVIDCLQSPTGFSFATAVGVDEEIDKATAQLPPNYLSIPHITACSDIDERSTRLYRIAEVYQLKTFLYLPLFLQECDAYMQTPTHCRTAHYGQAACLSSARSLLEAYLALYDMQPAAAIVDNSMKLSSFTALAAAVVLFLNLLAGDHLIMQPMMGSSESDTTLINRAAAVFEACAEGRSASLCGQCHAALADLISCSQTLGRGESREVTVPYFGRVEITRKEENTSSDSPRVPPVSRDVQAASPTMNLPPTSLIPDGYGNEDFSSLTIADDIFFSYHGHWESYLEEPHWTSESFEAGLDSANVDLDHHLTPDFNFPM